MGYPEDWDFYWKISEEKLDDGKWGNPFYSLEFLPELYSTEEYSGYRNRFKEADEFSSNQIGDMIDRDLENGNYHSSVGFGEYLAMVLREELGEESAILILQRMVKERGSLLVVD